MTIRMGIALIAAWLGGCAAYAPIDTTALTIGMSKQAAVDVLGVRASPIGAIRYDEAVVEVLEVHRLSHADSSIAEQYWLYFYNNELEHWGRPGDWRREADEIYEVRVR